METQEPLPKPLREYSDYKGIPVAKLYADNKLVWLAFYADDGASVLSQIRPSVAEADYEARELVAQRNRKITRVDPTVNKDAVIEQLNEAIDKICALHMEALQVTHGDIAPEQQCALDTYVAAVADIIVQVVEQNRD